MIIAIVGPTGVGKTKMSIELAKKYNGIIINADAMQVYKGLNIGTAKIKEEEKEGIEHLLFDIKDVNEDYTVFDYQKDVRELLDKYKDRNIIFVGGTGLYLRAALFDYRFKEENDNSNDYSNYTNQQLYDMCLKKDPNCKIHINNRVRLERFLNKEEVEIVEPKLLYDVSIIGLTTDRDILYDRINKRVDIMINNGLLDEVKYYYEKYPNSNALHRGIGYKELIDYLDNKCSLDDAIGKIKQNSRHYAKRQYTFFNNQFNVKWFNVDFNDFNNTINDVLEYLKNR